MSSEIIEAHPVRVAVIGSGGLWHTPVGAGFAYWEKP